MALGRWPLQASKGLWFESCIVLLIYTARTTGTVIWILHMDDMDRSSIPGSISTIVAQSHDSQESAKMAREGYVDPQISLWLIFIN